MNDQTDTDTTPNRRLLDDDFGAFIVATGTMPADQYTAWQQAVNGDLTAVTP